MSTQVDFLEDYILALRGCWPLKFLHVLQPLNCISSGTCGAGRPQVGLCPIFLVDYKITTRTSNRIRVSLQHFQCISAVMVITLEDSHCEPVVLVLQMIGVLAARRTMMSQLGGHHQKDLRTRHTKFTQSQTVIEPMCTHS